MYFRINLVGNPGYLPERFVTISTSRGVKDAHDKDEPPELTGGCAAIAVPSTGALDRIDAVQRERHQS